MANAPRQDASQNMIQGPRNVGMGNPNPVQQSPGPMGGSVYNNEGKLVERNPSSFRAGDDSPTRPVPGQGMPKPGRPMAAPAGQSAPFRPDGQRAPGLIAGNSPTLGEKNPLGNMPSGRRMPSRSSGRASRGRAAAQMPSRANFNYQMGGNG